MPNNPRNQPYRHIPILINPSDYETDLIFIAGHPVVIAAMDHSVDVDMEADEDGAFVYVCDNAGILALNFALAKVSLAGIAVDAFDIRLHGNILKGLDFYTENADEDLFSYMKAFGGVPKPVPE